MIKAIGIDLGTTNSCISWYRTVKGADKGSPKIVELDGKATIPSCVLFRDDKFIVGKEAYEKRYTDSVVYSVKRLMGTQEPIELVDAVMQTRIQLTPTEVSAEILKAIASKSGYMLGEIEDVTITVPAYFTPTQKEETKRAGELAGFKNINIINEPTAASLAYQLDVEEKETTMIFDLGGGTFDISIVEISPIKDTKKKNGNDFLEEFYGLDDSAALSGNTVIKVLDSDGNSKLGGDDIDQYILRRAVFVAQQKGKTFPTLENREERERAILSIESFKKMHMGGTITLDDGSELPVSLDSIKFGYNKVMKKCMDLVQPFIEKHRSRISKIILVGGSTKSPFVAEYLKGFIGDLPIYSELNPDEAVGLGASVNSAIKSGEIADLCFFDVLQDSLSIETEDGKLLTILEKNAVLPTTGSQNIEIAVGNIANIKVYMGSGYADKAEYLGHVQLTPQSNKEVINLEFMIDLDSILHIKATSRTSSVYKKLINISNMSRKVDVEVVNEEHKRQERVHKRRISNLTTTLNECRKIGKIMQEERLNKIEALLSEYRSAEDKVAFYQEHKKDFTLMTKKYGYYLTKTANTVIDTAMGDLTTRVETVDMDEHNIIDFPTSNRFQN